MLSPEKNKNMTEKMVVNPQKPLGGMMVYCPKQAPAQLIQKSWYWVDEENRAINNDQATGLLPFATWRVEDAQTLLDDKTIICFFPEDDVLAQKEAVLTLIDGAKKSNAALACYFPVSKDGRGFSTAALLRERFGYEGALYALGDLLLDQVTYLSRVGFDGIVPRADQNPQKALQALSTFTYRAQDDWRGIRTQKLKTAKQR